MILKALKTHGMLLSDGGEIALTFADDRNSTAKWADLGIEAQSFNDIGVDQFEVVELGDGNPAHLRLRAQSLSGYWSELPMCLPSSAREWMPSLR